MTVRDVRYAGFDAAQKAAGNSISRGLSEALWYDCPLTRINATREGWRDGDDFTEFVYSATDGAAKYIADQSDSIATVSGIEERGGVVRIAIGATDNNEAWFQAGAAISGPFNIYTGYGDLWFETRIRLDDVNDDYGNIMIGLSNPLAVGADIFQADNTALMADIDFVGFRTLPASGSTLQFVHQTTGSTTATVVAAGTLAEDTWHKVGFRYDDKTKLITPYFDGVALGTTVAASADYFPNGEELTFSAAMKVTSAHAVNFDIDWYDVVQIP